MLGFTGLEQQALHRICINENVSYRTQRISRAMEKTKIITSGSYNFDSLLIRLQSRDSMHVKNELLQLVCV